MAINSATPRRHRRLHRRHHSLPRVPRRRLGTSSATRTSRLHHRAGHGGGPQGRVGQAQHQGAGERGRTRGHNGWAQDIADVTGNALNFPAGRPGPHHRDPVRRDPEKADNTLTVRSVFIIAPDKSVKLTLTYPAATGELDEILVWWTAWRGPPRSPRRRTGRPAARSSSSLRQRRPGRELFSGFETVKPCADPDPVAVGDSTRARGARPPVKRHAAVGEGGVARAAVQRRLGAGRILDANAALRVQAHPATEGDVPEQPW